MTVVCHNPTGEGRHEIAEGARRLELAFTVDWGDADLRDTHAKPLMFCSFGCLSEWAFEKAAQHDTSTLVEGVE